MTRLEAAIVELVDAIRDEVASVSTPVASDPPERLLDVEEAAAALGIGRSKLYQLLDGGDVRSLAVGRRRLVPSSAIAEFIAEAGGGSRGRLGAAAVPGRPAVSRTLRPGDRSSA